MVHKYLKENWTGLVWTPWYNFKQVMETKNLLPTLPGLYRIKRIDQKQLMYIGQTGRDLRERVTDLIRNTLKEQMPFNDPHTAAPSLWAWKDAEGCEFECSVSPVDVKKEIREGLECFLLWQYRIESNESTICNHGRFHQDYEKSKSRKNSFRGGKLQDTAPRNSAWGESFPALMFQGTPISLDFMGLLWSNFMGWENLSEIPAKKGVYRIIGLETNTLVYIGQSKNLRIRLNQHSKKDWGQRVNFSYYVIEKADDVHLKEIENDLIGGFYSINKSVPIFQFQNLKEKS